MTLRQAISTRKGIFHIAILQMNEAKFLGYDIKPIHNLEAAEPHLDKEFVEVDGPGMLNLENLFQENRHLEEFVIGFEKQLSV